MTKKATTNHVALIAPLFDAYRVFYDQASDLEGAKYFLMARLAHEESVIFFSHDTTGTVTGFVQLYPLFSSTRMRRLWLLNDLFVAPAFRGMGYSVALIDAAKELCTATGACGLQLETAKTNSIGNRLYPRTNFKLDQEHNFYFWTP